jgi:hypothetical protein
LENRNKWNLLKSQIFEPTKTFILNARLISCLLKPVNLSILAPMLEIRIIGERF